jgi:hypothetical protein
LRRATDGRTTLGLAAFTVTASLLVLTVYFSDALTLASYAWDWSPDEGLALDYGRRAREAPATLYEPRAAAPFPSAYGPVLPLAMSTVVGTRSPLLWARILASAWTLAGAAAVFAMVRTAAGPLAALAAAALSLAALDLTFWHVLVRVDGLMVSLWLAGCAVLLPRRLLAGADRLSAGRIAAGAALLLAAVLTKPTAVLHAAPLVLGWWIVDRRSAVRLVSLLVATGLSLLAALQWATGGGFLWVNRLWSLHPSVPGQRALILGLFAARAWPLAAVAALLVLWRAGSHRDVRRDPGWLLVAGAVLVVPALSKSGAWWNYLLPLVPALAVLSGRLANGAEKPRRGAPAAALAAVALALVLTRTFPLPTGDDEATASALYAYVERQAARTPGPILVSRPDLASFLVHQPTEIEGSSFPHLAAAGAVGTERVLGRLRKGEYTLVVDAWPLPSEGGYPEAVAARYPLAGGCVTSYFFGSVLVNLRPRRDLFEPVPPAAGGRCGPAPGTTPSISALRQEGPRPE